MLSCLHELVTEGKTVVHAVIRAVRQPSIVVERIFLWHIALEPASGSQQVLKLVPSQLALQGRGTRTHFHLDWGAGQWL